MGMYIGEESDMTKTTAHITYEHYKPAGVDQGCFKPACHGRVLEIGFGSGVLLRSLRDAGNEVCGVDAGHDIVERARADGFDVALVDVSEQDLPFETDSFDAVYCYETFEHLSNPYRMVSEVRRVLKPRRPLFFSVPTQEHTMGYGVCRHAFVYPGLLEREHLERFFMQMYFRIDQYHEMDTGLIVHRFYQMTNGKHEDLPDIMDVIVGDYHVSQLYKHVLSPERLAEEVQREIDGYFNGIHWCLGRDGGLEQALHIAQHLCESYQGYAPVYMQLFECFYQRTHVDHARQFLEEMLEHCELPEDSAQKVRSLLQSLSTAGAAGA